MQLSRTPSPVPRAPCLPSLHADRAPLLRATSRRAAKTGDPSCGRDTEDPTPATVSLLRKWNFNAAVTSLR